MAFSILTLINWLTPKDAGSRRLVRDIAYGSDERQMLDIYGPKDVAGPRPVVFFIYGGSWSDGDKGNYEFVGRALAALGYIAVIADYRLIPQVEYPGFLSDCSAAFDWMIREIASYGGDPDQVALMGHSAGAYNAMMVLLDPQYIVARGHAGRVKAMIGLSGPYDFFPFDGRITLRTFGAVDHPATTQPINQPLDAAPPMLLASGDRDTLVYPRNTVALSKKLRAAGRDVIEIHYPKLGHPGTLLTLGRLARGRAPVLADCAAFLAKHLR